MDEKRTSLDAGRPAPEALRAELADTRAQMGNTIEALHGRLNPTVLKDQALESFHEIKATVTEELKQHFVEAKAAMREELAEVKASLKTEVMAEFEHAKEKVSEEFEHAKHKVSEEIAEAKSAMREATIGKVEHMVQHAQDSVIETKNSMIDTIKANPIPAALIGAGVAWMFFGRKTNRSTPRFDGGMQRQLGGESMSTGRSMNTSGSYNESVNTSGLTHKVGETASKAGHSVSSAVVGAAHHVGDFASESGHRVVAATHDAADSMGRVAHAAHDRASQIAHQVGDKSVAMARATTEGAVSLQRRTTNGYHANPIAFGAAVLAVGTAIGLAIPSSRREDKLMGAARDGLMKKAEGYAHDALDSVQCAAKEFADNTMKGVQDVMHEAKGDANKGETHKSGSNASASMHNTGINKSTANASTGFGNSSMSGDTKSSTSATKPEESNTTKKDGYPRV